MDEKVSCCNEWRTSSYSQPSGDCVEIATKSSDFIVIRDSKDESRSTLMFPLSEWKHFTRQIKGIGG